MAVRWGSVTHKNEGNDFDKYVASLIQSQLSPVREAERKAQAAQKAADDAKAKTSVKGRFGHLTDYWKSLMSYLDQQDPWAGLATDDVSRSNMGTAASEAARPSIGTVGDQFKVDNEEGFQTWKANNEAQAELSAVTDAARWQDALAGSFNSPDLLLSRTRYQLQQAQDSGDTALAKQLQDDLDFYESVIKQQQEYDRQQGLFSSWDAEHRGTETDFQKYLRTIAGYGGDEQADALQQRYEELQAKAEDPSLSERERETYRAQLADFDERYGYLLRQHGMYDGVTMQSQASYNEAVRNREDLEAQLERMQGETDIDKQAQDIDDESWELYYSGELGTEEERQQWVEDQYAKLREGGGAESNPDFQRIASQLQDAQLIEQYARGQIGTEAQQAVMYSAMTGDPAFADTVERGRQMYADMQAGLESTGLPAQEVADEKARYKQEQKDQLLAEGYTEDEAEEFAEYLAQGYINSELAGTSTLEHYDENHRPKEGWTKEQEDSYYWTLGEYGEEAASQVAYRINSSRAASEYYNDKMLRDQYFAENHPVLATALARLGNLTGGYDWLRMVTEGELNNGEVIDTLYQGMSRSAEVYTSTVAGMLSDIGSLNDLVNWMANGDANVKIPYLGNKTLGDMYQATSSALDSTIAYLVSGGNPAVINTIFFGSAAASEFRGLYESGYGFEASQQTSTGSGLAEGIGETISIEFLFSKSGAEWLKRGLIGFLGPQAVEGSEEIVTALVDRYFDDLINGANSKFNKEYLGYLASGMKEDEAKAMAEKTFWKGAGDQAFMAMVSIGLTQGGRYAIAAPSLARTYDPSTTGYTAEEVLDAATLAGGRAADVADRYRTRYGRTGRVSNYGIGRVMDELGDIKGTVRGGVSAQQASMDVDAAVEAARIKREEAEAKQAEADAASAQAFEQNAEQEGSAAEAAEYARARMAEEEAAKEPGETRMSGIDRAEAAGPEIDPETAARITELREGAASLRSTYAEAEELGALEDPDLAEIYNGFAEQADNMEAEADRLEGERRTTGEERAEKKEPEAPKTTESAREEAAEEKPEETPAPAGDNVKTLRDILDWMDDTSKEPPVEGLTPERAEKIIQDLGQKWGAQFNQPGLKSKGSTNTTVAAGRIREVLDVLERQDNRTSERERKGMREAAPHSKPKAQVMATDDGTISSASFADGKVTFTVKNGKGEAVRTMDRSELTGEAAELFNTLEDALGTAQATEAFNLMEPGQDATYYATDFAGMRLLGQLSRKGSFENAFKYNGGVLTEAQARKAYTIGQSMTARTGGTPVRGIRGTGRVTMDGGTINGMTLHAVANQEALRNSEDFKTVQSIARALGVDVVFYESQADEEGNFMDAQGAYLNGTIYLDVNAEMNKKGVGERMFFRTLSHELTHFLKDYAPQRYTELESRVVQYLAENKHIDFNGLVRSKIARASERLSYDGAVEEVIADACETMIRDSKTIRDLAMRKPGLFETIREYMARFFDSIVARHSEAKALEPYMREIQKLWDEALIEAVESRVSEETVEDFPARNEFNDYVRDMSKQRQNGTDRIAELYKQMQARNRVNTLLLLPAHTETKEEAKPAEKKQAPEQKKEKAAVKRRFEKAVQELIDVYAFDGEELSREDAEKMVMDYALTHDGYFSEVDEAKQKGKYKTKRQYVDEQRGKKETKFAMRDVVEETDRLVAVHNKSVNGLRRMLKRGGVPFPSIAVKKAGTPHEGFGEVSIVFPRSTIDPKASRWNRLYSNDAWTPTEPRTEYEVADTYRLKKMFEELLGSDVFSALKASSYLDSEQIERDLNSHEGDIFEALKGRAFLKYAYLKSIGKTPTAATTQERLDSFGIYKNEQLLAIFNSVDHKALQEMRYDSTETLQQVADALNKQFIDSIPDLLPGAKKKYSEHPVYTAEKINPRIIQDALNKYLDQGGVINMEVDAHQLKSDLDRNREIEDDPGYREWLEKTFDGIVVGSGIPNGKGLYTDSGNRRSFKQRHVPATLENIVQQMRKENERGIGMMGINLRGAATKAYGSVEEMRAESGKLLGEHIIDEVYDSYMQGFHERLHELERKAALTQSLGGWDSAQKILLEAIRDAKTKAQMDSILRKNAKWINYSTELTDALWDLRNDVQNMPAPYFEAKPRRVVSTDEALAYILPSDADSDVVNMLNDRGYNVLTYEAGNKQDRLEKLNSVEGAKFSDRDAEYMDAVKRGDMDAAQRMVDEAARAAGYTIHGYHGTAAKFTVFDKNKINSVWGENGGDLGFYFTPYESDAKGYASYAANGKEGNVVNAYLKMDKPLVVEDDGWGSAARQADIRNGDLKRWAKQGKHDGIIVRSTDEEMDDGLPDTVYVVFDSNQVKSADPVTYDDNGEVIPLSERFNSSKGDIRYSVREEFPAEVKEWYNNATPDQRTTAHGYFKTGTVSDVLQSIGVRPSDLYWRKYKIGTILEEHPELTIDDIVSVPDMLEHPVLIMKSRTVDNSIVVFGDLYTKSGKPIMAAVELTPKPGGKTEAEFALIASAYDRTMDNVRGLIQGSEILYLDNDKKRTDDWLKQLRVQFPSGQSIYGSIGSVTYKGNSVKIQGKTFAELGGTILPKTAKNSDRENLGYHAGDLGKAETVKYSERDDAKTDRELLMESTGATLTAAEKAELQKYRAKAEDFEERQRKVQAALEVLDTMVRTHSPDVQKQRTKVSNLQAGMQKALRELTAAEKNKTMLEIIRKEREIQRRRTSYATRETFTRRELRGRITRLYNDLNRRITSPSEKKNIPVPVMEQAIEVLQAINMDSSREGSKAGEALRNKLLNLKQKYHELQNDPDFRDAAAYDPIVAELLDNMIETVGETPIHRMSAAQMLAVYNALTALDKTARKALKIKMLGEERDAYEVAKQMSGETQSVKKPHKNFLAAYLNAQLSPERMFNRLGGYHKNSAWSQVYRMLNDGQLTATQIQMEGTMLFDGLLEGKDFERLIDPKETVDIGLKDRSGKAIPITRGMMVALYMHLQNEDNARHIAHGGLIVPNLGDYYRNRRNRGIDDSVHAVGYSEQFSELNRQLRKATTAEEKAEIKRQIAELEGEADAYLDGLRASIEKQLTAYDRKWIAAAQELFDVYSKGRLNETTMEVYGIKRATVENYFPIWVAGDFLNTPFESIAKDMSLENAGFMKERVGSSKPMRLADISDVSSSQIRRVAQYCGLMPAVRNFQKIWGKVETGYVSSLQNEVRQKFGQNGIDYIENLMADLNGARRGKEGALADFFNAVRGNMAQATLTLSLRTAMGQAASYPSAAAVVGWKALNKALVRGGKNGMPISRADQELIRKYSPLLWYRLQGYSSVELGDLASGNSKTAQIWKKMRWATGWIQAMDGATVGRLWYAAQYYVDDHNKALKKGTDAYYQEVAKVFNDIVERTQPDYTTLQRPDILRNPNAMVKQLTMFLTQRLQNFNILYDAAATYNQMRADAKAGKATSADVAQARQTLGRSISSQLVAAATITAFKFLADMILHSMNAYRDDDDELTGESKSLALLDMFIDSLTGNILGGGEVYDIIESKVFDKPYYGIDVAGVSTVTDVIEAANKAMDAAMKDDATWQTFWKEGGHTLMQKIATLLGIPEANAEKIVKGIWNHGVDIKNGEFGSFEAGVDRTTAQQAHRLWRAYNEGNFGQAKKIREQVGDDEKLDKALATYIKQQFKDGEISQAQAKKQLMKWCGKDEKTAEKMMREFASEVETGIKYANIGEALAAGDISEAEAVKMWQKYGGMDEIKAKAKASFTLYQQENPATKFDASSYQIWYTKYRDILTAPQYEGYYDAMKACRGKDKDGDGKADSGTVKAEKLKVIDALPISDEKKDALYLLNNWSQNTLKDAPWRKRSRRK